MFAGQGSQYYGMARELYQNHPVFRDWMDYGARLAEPLIGCSLTKLLYEAPGNFREPFDRTLHTHPAIFMLNYSLAQALVHEGIRPSALLGYSLGELAALTFAGAIGLEEALAYVVESARLVEEGTEPAGMMAILGPASLYSLKPALFERTTLACHNHAEHFVIAGAPGDLKRIQEALARENCLSQILPIRNGFHSPFLDPVAGRLQMLGAGWAGGKIGMPIYSCALRQTLTERDAGAAYGWEVIRRPVYFEATISILERSGSWTYLDAGPSGTLAGFVKKIIGLGEASRALPFVNPFGKEMRALDKLKAALET